MAWCRPATEKAESTQLPAVFILPPAKASALALEHFCAGRYREAEPLYRAALAGWERMAAVAARNGIVTAVNLGTLLRPRAASRRPNRCCSTVSAGSKLWNLPARARAAWSGRMRTAA